MLFAFDFSLIKAHKDCLVLINLSLDVLCFLFQMHMYDELLFYNIKKNEWLKVTAPKAPPPRSAHQVNCSIIRQTVKLCTDAVKDFSLNIYRGA